MAAPRKSLNPGIVHHLSPLQQVVFWPASWTMRLFTRTWRVRWRAEEADRLRSLARPPVYVVWHNRSLVFPEVISRIMDPSRIACLISASRLAAWETAYFGWCGFPVIRGSSTRRGFHATREMLRLHRRGIGLGISPDGPSGPLYTIKRGALVMPRKLDCPLVLFGASSRFSHRLRTWDRHLVPYPFARLEVRLKVIDPFPASLGEEALATRLSQELAEINPDPFPCQPTTPRDPS